ncbi:type II toxin-antitoxin system VapC family toxin [Paractinoplanes hotanensis]|uniref:Ribonuclease VapC n=1 Tax=Paractinoplanes hotanensis TaxID=2906497 RepID=A0ABT0Y602_9ACTN|nr:type II toxin-antitoxin system VapC family toxin [Actinoplanes hotanensis]MCM4081463.1 type II toxin-antitoxin system VapC family toxin [Actinoplanes hotanensis]
MKYVIVDTDAFSHLWQNPAAASWFASHLIGAVPVISFTTIAEVHFGAAKRSWGPKRIDQLEEAIRRYVVAPYDDDLARLWGRLKSHAQRAGHALGQNSQTNDLWICATAIYHNAPLLTLNRRHFENFPGLVILS